MTDSEIRRVPFDRPNIDAWAPIDTRHSNWPVVYVLHDRKMVYVGETLNAEVRLKQHLDSPERSRLNEAIVIVDESYNKSVCLDLESHLIRLLSGDGVLTVLNRNVGITDADYFGRSEYQARFDEIFDELLALGLFSRSIPEIENSDLFKYSPYKALSSDQAVAVESILEDVFEDISSGRKSTAVVQGDPGTGKTILGVFLLKLLRDIAIHRPDDPVDEDSLFSGLFAPSFVEIASELKVGLVIPQQALRKSVREVFRKTPGLNGHVRVLSAFDVGESTDRFDLLVVDETHRLTQRSNQAAGVLNGKYSWINRELFGNDDVSHTQLDWIIAQSDHQVLLLDTEQSVRPGDLPLERTNDLIRSAVGEGRHYPLKSQMRVRAAEDYVGYIRNVLAGTQTQRVDFTDYELRMFDDLAELYRELGRREAEFGLSRLIAGYAWKWVSRGNPELFDIELDGLRFRWNTTTTDWVNTPNAFDEVGSIHTVQGYDLNYAGVIIGRDLIFDPGNSSIRVDRTNYFDKKGMENNRVLGITYSDDDLLRYITNIYGVLLTRGIRGTFVYVCDPALREHLRKYL